MKIYQRRIDKTHTELTGHTPPGQPSHLYVHIRYVTRVAGYTSTIRVYQRRFACSPLQEACVEPPQHRGQHSGQAHKEHIRHTVEVNKLRDSAMGLKGGVSQS
jgi:hypothetical protein